MLEKGEILAGLLIATVLLMKLVDFLIGYLKAQIGYTSKSDETLLRILKELEETKAELKSLERRMVEGDTKLRDELWARVSVLLKARD